MTPETLPNRSALKGRGREEEGSTTTTTNVVEGREVGGGGHENESGLAELLRARGVQASLPSLLAVCSPEGIEGACRWWDAQSNAGPGVLVDAIRAGGKLGWQPKRSLAAQQDEYAASIVAWLWKNFPGLCDERWGPHPAAIAEVIRLHWRHGKGSLRRSEHGPAIREAVRRFDAKHGTGAKA